MEVIRQLYGTNSKIQCQTQTGQSCHTEISCAELDKQTQSIAFEMEIDSATFKLPLTTLMRQPNQGCRILLTNLGEGEQAQNIVLGSAFFQQFMAEFTPATDKDNSKVTFYSKNDSLSGA
jgi:hypothetical protein